MSTSPTAGRGAAGHRPVLTGARSAHAALTVNDLSKLWRFSDDDVAETFALLEAVRATAESQQVAVLGEARTRGLGASNGWGTVDWATTTAAGMSTGHASALQTVAAACADPSLAILAAAVESGAVSLPKAVQLARFHATAAPVADPGQLADDMAILVESARQLSDKQLAVAIRHADALLRPERDAEHLKARRRAARALHKSSGPAGTTTYKLVLDPEGAAILDAAIDPLARPARDPDTKDHDPRSPAPRADALLTVLGRGSPPPETRPRPPRPPSWSPSTTTPSRAWCAAPA